jgi:hypothetical protein
MGTSCCPSELTQPLSIQLKISKHRKENKVATRRTHYEHTQSAPVPEPETDNTDGKIWLQDIVQPTEKPLEVHLDDDPVVVATEEKPQKEEKPELKVEASQPEPVEAKPSADDEAFKRLKSQLDREIKARESERERIRQLESDRTAVQQRLTQEQERSFAAQREQLDAQELAIDNAISHLENQAAQAKREFTRALSEGDYESASAANELLADAKANLSRLKDGKQAVEAQKKAPAPQRDQPQQQYQPNTLYDRIEAYIQQPGHSPRVQQYLRDNYDDLFSDFDSGANRLSRLLGGHYITKSDGVIEGSDAYFDRLSQHMGYTKAPELEPVKAAPPPVKSTKHIPPSAPVSRGNNHSGGDSPTSITLTPAMVQFCRDSGIDPKVYARNLLRAREGGKDPNYEGPRFTADII